MAVMVLRACTNLGGTGTSIVRSTGWNLGGRSAVTVLEYFSVIILAFFLGFTSVTTVSEWLSRPDMYSSSEVKVRLTRFSVVVTVCTLQTV